MKTTRNNNDRKRALIAELLNNEVYQQNSALIRSLTNKLMSLPAYSLGHLLMIQQLKGGN